MRIINGQVLTGSWQFEPVDLVLAGDRIASLKKRPAESNRCESEEEFIDSSGCLIIPGLIDLHIHGCDGDDFSDGRADAIHTIARNLARCGVTSFLATTVSLMPDQLMNVITSFNQYSEQISPYESQLLGIRLEGPFLAMKKKGAQNISALIPPDASLIDKLAQSSITLLKMIDVAPELPGALEFIQEFSDRMVVALGHSAASYDLASAAFAAGASHVTHLFNAMNPYLHREPGLIGAASDAKVSVELIADGHHVHPSVIRSAFQWFGADHVVLISDAMRACHRPDGQYDLGGLPVTVQNEKATLPDGTIAGSVLDLMQIVRKAVAAGISLPVAVKAASWNAAAVLGLNDQRGAILPGLQADLVILHPDLTPKQVLIAGQRID